MNIKNTMPSSASRCVVAFSGNQAVHEDRAVRRDTGTQALKTIANAQAAPRQALLRLERPTADIRIRPSTAGTLCYAADKVGSDARAVWASRRFLVSAISSASSSVSLANNCSARCSAVFVFRSRISRDFTLRSNRVGIRRFKCS